jgi:hypothetical protein
MAHASCLLDKKGYMHARACTRPLARAHVHAHTQTNMEYLLLFHGNNDSRTRLNVTLYVHCLSCYFSALYNKNYVLVRNVLLTISSSIEVNVTQNKSENQKRFSEQFAIFALPGVKRVHVKGETRRVSEMYLRRA